MGLSWDLISQFVKVTDDSKKEKTETTVYGTIVKYADRFYVRIDGSDQLTPYETTTDVAEGDRVTVRIKNHTATVNGNLDSPAARTDDLKGLAESVVEMGTVIADKVDTKVLEAEKARIDELVAENVTIKGKIDANEAEIGKIKTDYIDAKAIDAKYATIESLKATNADIYNLTATYGQFADLIATKADIKDLDAINATIENLDATYAKIDSLDATYAKITDLDAINTTIGNLDATYAKIESLSAINASIETLTAQKASISDLQAVSATIGSLQADVGAIDTLIFGSASGNVIQSSFANAVIAQLGNAQIKSAMIDSISASKITAGKISTNNVEIGSDDGRMLLSDETMQISDGTRVRVQIGKDASGDYSINIWDDTGKLMFSEGGITENGIKDAIIRNDMVSENANISAGKLDIDSLFEEINGSEKTIKSNKIYFDEKNQSLDVLFTTLTTDVNSLSNSVSSQGTQLSVIQGHITSKIWEQDIDEAVGLMNTKYSEVVSDVDSIRASIGDVFDGGKNLLKGTKDFTKQSGDTPGFTLGLGELIEEKYKDFGVRHYKNANSNSPTFAWYSEAFDPEPGAQYTLSFYAKGTKVRVYLVDGGYKVVKAVSSQDKVTTDKNGTIDIDLSSEWQRYWVTFTLESANTQSVTGKKSVVFSVPPSSEVYLCGLMFEKGGTASNWSYHQDEVASRYTNLVISLEGLTSEVRSNYVTKNDADEQYAAKSSYSSLQQTVDELSLTVKEIGTSGTNLLKGTKDFTKKSGDTPGFTTGAAELIEEKHQDFSVRYHKNTHTSASHQLLLYEEAFDPEPGAQYTLSFYAKGTKVRVYLENGGYKVVKAVSSQGTEVTSNQYGQIDIVLSNDWQRYWVTFTLENTNTLSSTGKKSVEFSTPPSSEVYLCGLMFANGSKVSIWSPHPDEAGDTIDSLNTKVASLVVTVEGINTTVNDINGDYTKLSQTINGISSKVTSVEGNYSTLSQTVNSMTFIVESINGDYTTLSQTVNGINTRVGTIEGDYSTLSQTVNGINTRVGTVEGNYSTLSQTVSGITSRVDTIEGDYSTIEQTANSIDLSVKSIVIGGTNMLKNTKPFKGDMIVNGNSTLVENETYNGFAIRTFDNSSATSGYKDVVSFDDGYPIELGGEYTFSFYAKGSGTEKLSTFFYGPTNYVKVAKAVQSNGVVSTSEDGNTKWTLTNEWKRYWVTWTLKTTGDASIGKWILFRSYFGGTVSVCGCQLEKGNKATDWSYHPEDTNDAFASLKVNVNDITSRVGTVETSYGELQVTVNGITSRVTSVEGNYTALTTKVNGVYADIYNTDGKLETSLKTTREGIEAMLNGLQVGCTNLLRNTRNPQDASYWTRGNRIIDSDLNEYVFYISNSNTTESIAGTSRIRVEAGKKYTISAYVKRTSNVKSIDFFLLSRKKGETVDYNNSMIQSKINMIPDANKWTKLTWTFEVVADAYEGYLRIDHNGSTDGKEAILYYTMIKMEKGDKATDWSPSPEEVAEQISGASATATNYLKFDTSGLVVGNHTGSELRGNVLIDTDSVDIRNGTSVLSTFTANSIRLGLTSSKNVIVDTDGVHLYEGSTYMAYFKPTEVRLGDKSSNHTNIKIANNLITFRAGDTATATYGANDIHLGLNAQDTTIWLCADIGRITGYEDQYGMGVSMTSSVLSFSADRRIVLDATNDASVSRRGAAFISLHPSNSSGTEGPFINLNIEDYNTSTHELDYSGLTIENGNMYLTVEDNGSNSIGWIDITPTQVEIGPYLKTSTLSTGLAWINNIAFDGNNHVLWSGGEQMGANKQITFSESVSSQPNGIVLIFSRYSSSTVQNYHWQSFFVPKYQIVTHSGGGHTFMLTTDGAFGVIAAKYLYLRDTGITGNAINEAPSKSTGLTYYKYSNNSYVDNAVTFQNSGFVLRYVIGV